MSSEYEYKKKKLSDYEIFMIDFELENSVELEKLMMIEAEDLIDACDFNDLKERGDIFIDNLNEAYDCLQQMYGEESQNHFSESDPLFEDLELESTLKELKRLNYSEAALDELKNFDLITNKIDRKLILLRK
jgi:hypothetical protein